jgi:mannose-6-phosphate isomerase-like protein (cupin superfamily)
VNGIEFLDGRIMVICPSNCRSKPRHKEKGLEAKEDQIGEGVAHVTRGTGRSEWVFGELVTYKVTAEQTGGAYSLFEVASRPGKGGPPPHIQHRHDEAFYVLEGEYDFLVAGLTISACAGSLVYVPKGNLHAHNNVGEEPGRMLMSQTPGGSYERLFEEISEERRDGSTLPVSEAAPDMEMIAKIAAEYGIEIPPSEKRTQTQGLVSERSERATRRSVYADGDAAKKGGW